MNEGAIDTSEQIMLSVNVIVTSADLTDQHNIPFANTSNFILGMSGLSSTITNIKIKFSMEFLSPNINILEISNPNSLEFFHFTYIIFGETNC